MKEKDTKPKESDKSRNGKWKKKLLSFFDSTFLIVFLSGLLWLFIRSHF